MTFIERLIQQMTMTLIFIIGSGIAKRLGLLSSFRLKLDYWVTVLLIIAYVTISAFVIHTVKDRIRNES